MNTFKNKSAITQNQNKQQSDNQSSIPQNHSNKKSKFAQGDLLIHQQFTRYGTNAKEWIKKCALLLPEIERRKIWQKKGFKSIHEYAAKLAGMSQRTVDDALWALGKIGDKSALMKIAEEKGINAIKPVATISTIESDAFWAEKAKNMSVHDLETYVRDVRNGMGSVELKSNSIFDSETTDSCEKDRRNLQIKFPHVGDFQPVKPTIAITMELKPETVQKLEKIKGTGTWDEAIQKLLQTREQQLEQTKPQPVQTNSRHIPTKIEDFVTERDFNKCAFPGCNRPYAQLHHIQGFARENIHDPDRIFCLCDAHHSLAHQGLIENEHMPPTFWRIRQEPDENSQRFALDRLVAKFKNTATG